MKNMTERDLGIPRSSSHELTSTYFLNKIDIGLTITNQLTGSPLAPGFPGEPLFP